jgi:hypothetical protein
MGRLVRLVIVGGGIGLGLLATGIAAAMDRKRMSEKKPADSSDVRHAIKPKYRRVWLWPS